MSFLQILDEPEATSTSHRVEGPERVDCIKIHDLFLNCNSLAHLFEDFLAIGHGLTKKMMMLYNK